MQITPINQTNFNGKFKRTSTLENIMKNADKEVLGKFNDIIKRASKVDDGIIFEINESRKTSVIGGYAQRVSTFLLSKKTKEDFVANPYSYKDVVLFDLLSKEKEQNQLTGVLNHFISSLESIYPKFHNKSSEQILEEINKNLI